MSDDPNVDQPRHLSGDIHSIIVSFLWRQNDQASVNAFMQTSRELRLRTSALISKIKLTDMLAQGHFPRHATLRTLDLALPVEKATMWLQAIWTVVPERLRLVSKILVHTDCTSNDYEWDAMPEHLKALPEVISYACSNTASLELVSLFDGSALDTTAFLRALGQHGLPHLLELRVGRLPGREIVEIYDWSPTQMAACFPPGLRKLALPCVVIHNELLQYLVNMPSLIELEAFSLCPGARGPFPVVQSEACTWQVLRLQELPHWGLINSFTAWPGLRLEVLPQAAKDKPWLYPAFEWGLGAPSLELAAAVGEAAAKLAACIDDPLHLLSHHRYGLVLAFDNIMGPAASDAAAAVALISALAPLDGFLRGVRLVRWRVTAEVLQALTVSLPNTVRLGLKHCFMNKGAWRRLMVQPRLGSLAFLGNTRISLYKVLWLAKGVRQLMEISVGLGCMTAVDKRAMPEAVASLAGQRRQPPVIFQMLGQSDSPGPWLGP